MNTITNRAPDELNDSGAEQPECVVKGTVRLPDGSPAAGLVVSAFDRTLRGEQALGRGQTDAGGSYQIRYSAAKGNAGLVVKVLGAEDRLLATSPVLFNAPRLAQVDLTIPAEESAPVSLFEQIGRGVTPRLENLKVSELEQDRRHQDLSFLSGETGVEKAALARFVVAHKLAEQAIQAEFWFALLGGSLYEYTEERSLAQQVAAVLETLPSLGAAAARTALARAFSQNEIPQALQEKADGWVEAFLQFAAGQAVGESPKPTFVKLALADAGISDAAKQATFARLFNVYKALTPEVLAALEADPSFDASEVADLRASFELAGLTQGDFSVVTTLKEAFGVRRPEQIRKLAKQSEDEWVRFVAAKHAAGAMNLPIGVGIAAGPVQVPEAEVYGKMLARQFREAFPTTAFAGGLERALANGGAHGLRQAQELRGFLDRHADFELLNTPVDDFLNTRVAADLRALAEDPTFRLELKAAQRVFKLAPTFEATDALLADGLHSAQQVYRLGQSEFVRRYAGRAGLSAESARLAWNRAADTHAAVLTLVADLKALDAQALPLALQNDSQALAAFPNWNNLFAAGDLCECEHCRSVLSPAAYFADLLMFLKDRKAKNPSQTVKDILFNRRPDLGFLELNCDNAQTPLPYIDVVCEVLEQVVAADAIELPGFAAMPADPAAARAAVAGALAAQGISLGAGVSLSQVQPADPSRWVAHGDDATYLLKKVGPAPNFFAQRLPNTKAGAAELRAYPQYVNPQAYEKLRAAKFPLGLPFDLFAEEVRAAFQKVNLKRWDVMQTLRGAAAPNNPSDGEIAAEYFGISADASAAFDERRLILVADATVAGQQQVWGETGNAAWLEAVGNVKRFLHKTGLEYNQLLALLDLKFINPAGDIAIQHLDGSYDTGQKVIQALDAHKLDRIHRFLRLWRKLQGWKLWELDLVIGHPRIGNGALNESFLINLFYFSQLRKRLGTKTTVEQVCALFANLNTQSRFTKLHEKREEALYQSLFLNKRLINPLDPAFLLDPGTGDLPAGEKLSAHHPVVLAALGMREADLRVLEGLTKASNGEDYIADSLTLANLSFLWRHAWLSRLLKLKAEEWKIVLKLCGQDVADFSNPRAAWEFVERVDQLKAAGFTPDELTWLLAADRSAKAAAKETDAARFLLALRKDVQAIQAEHDPAQYDFLTAAPPSDVARLTALLAALLQKLNHDEAATQFFIATLRDEVGQETIVPGLPPDFDFPPAIKQAIRIRYDQATATLRFSGLMTGAQRATLLTDPALAAVTGIAAYAKAIDAFFERPRLALKFYDPLFSAPLAGLPAAVDFKALPDAALAQQISYDAEQRLLRFAGILSNAQKAALDALSADAVYRAAVASLAAQPRQIAAPDRRIWLSDAELLFPLRDLEAPAADHLAENLATAATKALAHLSQTLSQGAVVQRGSAQLGLSGALTRRLLAHAPLLPDTLLDHLTGAFAATTGVVDYATLKTTFDGWFWASRAATMLKKWKLTLADFEQIAALAAPAHLLAFQTLPLDGAGPIVAIDRFLRTSRLLRLRESLPETQTTLFDVLEKLSAGTYAAADDFAADVQRMNEAWPAAEVEALTATLDLAYPADYLLAESWERVRRAFSLIDTLNAGADTLKTLAAATMGAAQAKTVKALLRAKFGAETWLTLSAEIQDALRERKRDALAAYLLTQPKPADAPSGKWENTNDLYAYHLLDVEMAACQLTSRLVQASGAVQLFVQRCFMGLEPGVVVKADGDDGDSAWRWWKWMRKYRVWEANRKVFLWPENWIEPELKQDRSPFFKDLEDELLQNEITQHSVETAFSNYVEKVGGVAQLEIAGFYQEDDGDDAVIHVFGRTPGAEPRLYYYRRYDYRQWTPWEQVDLDITGEYLIPAVVNKRLLLFWPVFTEVPDEAENTAPVPIPTPGAALANVKLTVKRLRVQLAVSEYHQGRWTPRKVSKDFYQSGWITMVDIVQKFYRFFPIDRSEIDGRFGIKFDGYSLGRDGVEQAELHSAFEVAPGKGVPERASFPGNYQHAIRPEWHAIGYYNNKFYTSFSKWLELGRPTEFGQLINRRDLPENDFTIENTFASASDSLRYTPVLRQTPWLFTMSPPWHLSYFDKLMSEGSTTPVGVWLPFFYNDKKRTFFVLPARWSENVRSYYPQIKHAYRQQEDFLEQEAQTQADNYDLAGITPDDRKELEQELWVLFPEEAPPPYTDAQVRQLIKQLIMRINRYFLGDQALQQFQSRQFHFKNYYHPFAGDFAKLVYNPLKGIPALMSRETQLKDSGFSFRGHYRPTASVVDPATEDHHPKEIVDFTPDGAYSPYNWELFFHVPLLIANALSKNQRFEEARDWYHFIFNPLGVEGATPGGSPMSKYWITKPFFETTDPQYVQQRIDTILRMLAGDTSLPGSAQAKKDLEDQVRDWRTNPFEPHRIAGYRTVAYQKTVVMKYLDNLIAWGDHLFRQDSMESINEATQLYILAAEILGPPPRTIPPRAKPPVESFNELETQFDSFSNALVEVENLVPLLPGSLQAGVDSAPLPMLYFCIPHNDKLLGYWDTVADRLYKIRHCMTIEGVTRQLALFEPPIDPGALVKAAAAGVDIGGALADLSAPLPLYRFNVLLQKANEVCGDVKMLGGALLAALEKQDAEALGLLRQSQEIKLLEALKSVREQQIEEAREHLEGIKRSRAVVEARRNYYRDIEKIIPGEQLSLDRQKTAFDHQNQAHDINFSASMLGYLPSLTVGSSGFGGSPHVTAQWGTGNIISALQALAGSETQLSNAASFVASTAATLAGYERRFDDYKLQERLADQELEQIDNQIGAAELRVAIAQQELENHLLQIDNARATDSFMRSKYTNQELYQWQVGQISGLYFQSYQLAYDLAKRAERCFRFELGLQDSSYISFGHWDSLKKGLLSGEKLQYDLRRLETAYLEHNRREFELTKHVSLTLLDPLALVRLRETGRCFLRLPEEIFDLDYPGHYFRRIKSVSLTLPCVAGPYTTISCTLRLVKHSIRINTTNGDNGYPRNTDGQGLPADDGRFVEHNIPVKAIAASTAQNDSGVFELSFRDERYLPFEGAGAVSEWSLELFSDLPSNNPDPANPDFGQPLRQFDYGSISDAILHVKYTAREAADGFKNGAVAHLREYFSQDQTTHSLRMFNLRQEFPSQWQRFLHPSNAANGNIFELELTPALFPIRDAGKTLKVNTLWLLARCTDTGSYQIVMTPPLDEADVMILAPNGHYGGLHFNQKDVATLGIELAPTTPPVKWKLRMTGPGGGNLTEGPAQGGMEVEDLVLVLGYEWG